jgi:HEAT repeat protein
LADEDPNVQNCAASSLANQGLLAARHFESALSHPSPSVRRWAAVGLGRVNAGDAQERIVELLARALNDSHATVRYAAAESLNNVANRTQYVNGVRAPSPAEKAVPGLTRLLADADRETRLQAALTLANLGTSTPQVQEVLNDALTVPSLSPDLRNRIRTALHPNR